MQKQITWTRPRLISNNMNNIFHRMEWWNDRNTSPRRSHVDSNEVRLMESRQSHLQSSNHMTMYSYHYTKYSKPRKLVEWSRGDGQQRQRPHTASESGRPQSLRAPRRLVVRIANLVRRHRLSGSIVSEFCSYVICGAITMIGCQYCD